MRIYMLIVCLLAFPSLARPQQPANPAKTNAGIPSAPGHTRTALDDAFEAKIESEWGAIKSKDKKAYGELLADDYEGVEVDGRGERTKLQAIDELTETNVANYSLWGLKVVPAGADAALVIYEATMQFPPKAQFRYSRVYISELWERRGGQWKEVHYQETHVK
jgi:hypothetical protein